ncbi:MAG: glycosyltransferase, partial [Lentisphaerota bacterium]
MANGHTFSLFYAVQGALDSYKRFSAAREVLIKSSNRWLWDQYYILPHINRGKMDLIFNPKLSLPLMASCKTVFTMHGLEQFAAPWVYKPLDRLYFSMTMPLYCRKADAILVMSETGKRDLQVFLKADESKIHVIPESYNESCAVIGDWDLLEKVRKKYHLPHRFVLFIGGITPLKNIPTLLRAFASLKQQGFRHKLVLAGFRRWKFEKDLALIEQLHLEKEVLEIGFIDDQDVAA